MPCYTTTCLQIVKQFSFERISQLCICFTYDNKRIINLRILILYSNIMMSFFCFVLLMLPFCGAFPSEPKCSKYDYEEKTLERMIRMEYAVERMLEENKAVERRIADSLTTLQNEKKQMQVIHL